MCNLTPHQELFLLCYFYIYLHRLHFEWIILPMHNAEVSFTDHLILVHWVMQIFPLLVHFIIYHQKITLLLSLLMSSDKFSSIGKLLISSEWQTPWISKIIIFAWKLYLIIGYKYWHLFFLKQQAHFIYFWENMCQILRSKWHNLSVRHSFK